MRGPAPLGAERRARRSRKAGAPLARAPYNPRALFPKLHPLPGLDWSVPSFGPMVALGFLLATWILARLARRYDRAPVHDPEPWAEVPIWVLIGILAGARLLYVIVELARGSEVGAEFLERPWLVLAFWRGGLVMYGGLFGGILGGYLCARKRGIPFWYGLDMGLTAGFFGLAVGRIGCFLVGDDFGRIVPPERADWPLPLVVHVPDPLPVGSLFGAANAGQALYATQLWMCFNALCLGLFGLWMLRRRRFAGQVALLLVAFYAVTRSAIESFRGDEVRGTWFGGSISTSQLISIGAGLLAVALYVQRSRSAPRMS